MKLLKDKRHWLGWILSASAILGASYLTVKYLIPPGSSDMVMLAIFFVVILTTEVIVDLIKHKTRLQ